MTSMPDDETLVRPLSDSDQRLEKLFEDLERGSLDTLEAAARQIITLSTTLLGAFFGLLAIKDAPAYLACGEVKVLAAVALGGFFASLLFAMNAVLPRRYALPSADLTAKREALHAMLAHKQRSLARASYLFGGAALAMLVAALDILFVHL